MVSRKNEVNIMVKNSVDVIFGGLSYWMFGYAFSFGTDPGTNGFCGGCYFILSLVQRLVHKSHAKDCRNIEITVGL